jgi:acyl-[acyl-carrier-protein]-phospholipid O-acyltransferase/long-chain-fatty-acid--[acyl-carrier-protein] ligase
MKTESEPRTAASRSLAGLQWTQAIGAFNDNAWKMIVAAILLRGLGSSAEDEAEKQWRTMLAMIAFTAPLALFSLPAGAIVDRCRKSSVIKVAKLAEILLMAAGALALLLEPTEPTLPLVVLALMGLQSALFSPAKYGIVPEIVAHQDLSKANGRLEMFTFVAIVAGSALGPALLGIAPQTPVVAGLALTALAVLGYRAATRIERTEPARLSGGFAVAIRGASAAALADRPLLFAILGQAFFWSISSLLGQNLFVYAAGTLALDESLTGAPLGLLAEGVGAGAEIAGRLSRGRVETGFVPLGAILLAAFTLLLGALTPGLLGTLVLLLLLGVASGFVIVPLDALLQWRAPEQHRASVIALANALAFSGMLLGSLLGGSLAAAGTSTAGIFLGAGAITLLGTAFAVFVLPEALLRTVLLLAVRTFYRLRVVGLENVPAKGGVLLAPNHVSFVDGALLSVALDRPVRFVVDRAQYERKGMKPFLELMKAIPISQTGGPRQILRALKDAGQKLDEGEVVAIFPEGQITRTGALLPFRRGIERIVKGRTAPIVPVHLDRVWGSIFSFARGRAGLRLPEKLRWPVTISFGTPLAPETPVSRVRSAVVELSARAWFEREAETLPLHRSFLAAARRRPLRLCLADRTRGRLSRIGTVAAAVALARALRAAWFGQPRVGILLPPSIAGALANVAAAFAGRIAVHLNWTAGAAGMASAAKQAELQTVLTSREFLSRAKIGLPEGVQPIWLEDVRPTISTLDRSWAFLLAAFAPGKALERACGATRHPVAGDVATIIFSSGSTGEPKGVMLTHFNLDTNITAVAQVFRPQADDRLLGVLPLFHSFGTMSLWFSLLRGIPLVLHPSPLDAEAVGELVLNERITLLLATPTFLQLYLRRCTPEQFGSLRIVMAGAEKLTDRLAEAFEENFGIRPLEGYGATECSPVIAASVPSFRAPGFFQAGSRRGFVGPPIPCMTAKVVDPDTFEELPLDTPGMLLVRGPNVMQGYLGRDDLTAKALRDGYYVTGDIAMLSEDGFIRITDRLARFSKIGGEMVPHGKVEEALHQAAGSTLQVFVVTSLADEKKGEKLAVVTTLDLEVVPAVLEKLATMGLPNLFLPRRDAFVKVDAIPLLGTGKVDLRGARDAARRALDGAVD